MKKKKYDTSVVMLYLIGKEGLLPKPFRKQIPYSTISSWRKNGIHSYVGNEYRYLFLDNFNYAELKEEHRRVYKILKSISRVWVLLHQYSYPLIELAKKDPLLQKRLLVAVGLLQEHLGIRKALKVFGISGSLYKLWSSLSEAHCSHSATSVCARRYPQQLHRQEAMKMKRLLTCAKYANWPIVSIAGLGLRKNSVVASLFTWYKYARLWQIKPVEQNKELKITGLVSTRPNEYLHIDTTFYNLNEAHKACIAFVVDNFSRMILGFHVAEKKTFSLVKIALQNALQTIALHPDQSHSFLVSDGGSENHHSEINRFLAALSDYKIGGAGQTDHLSPI